MSQSSILVIAKAIPPFIGGIEAYSAEIASAYVQCGLRVMLLTPEACIVPGVDGRLNRSPQGAKAAPQWIALVKILASLWRLRKKEWSWVHATSWRMALPVLLMGMGGRLVISVHGREVTGQQGLMARLAGWVLRKARLIVYVSEATRREVHHYFPELVTASSVVAWNGTSFSESRPAGEVSANLRDPLRILTVARLVKRKNLAFAVAAVAKLSSEITRPVSYVITGTGAEREAVARAIRDAGVLNGEIKLAGYVSDDELQCLYRDADIFLHPQSSAHDASDVEGFGISIVDAMSHGVPVVCGKDGGPSEYISHGENGFLVGGLDLGEAVDCLSLLASNQALRQRIGEAGRSFVREHMSWPNHVSKVLKELAAH
jgi:glycosyltransferase involved in cell wall biosynthesis